MESNWRQMNGKKKKNQTTQEHMISEIQFSWPWLFALTMHPSSAVKPSFTLWSIHTSGIQCSCWLIPGLQKRRGEETSSTHRVPTTPDQPCQRYPRQCDTEKHNTEWRHQPKLLLSLCIQMQRWMKERNTTLTKWLSKLAKVASSKH